MQQTKQKYVLELAYKGTKYHGWQVQPNASTVQARVDEVLSVICQEKIETLGSGRTDAGVHAEQQFVHFETSKKLDDQLVFRFNGISDSSIVAKSLRKVGSTFHARFDAKSRAYRYRIRNTKTPFLDDLHYYFSPDLDVSTMNKAAKLLLGKQDFEAFSKVNTDVVTFFCEIEKAEWVWEGEALEFYIKADRFLRGMVRAVVGTLLDIGQGKISEDDFRKIMASKDRQKAGRSVPASGLFLVEVNYNWEDHVL